MYLSSLLFSSSLLALLASIAYQLHVLNELYGIIPSHSPSSCIGVRSSFEGLSLVGMEDMVRTGHWLLGASDDRTSWFGQHVPASEILPTLGKENQGRLFRVNTENKEVNMVELIGFMHEDFHPHGVGMWKNRLFVVNHRRDGDFVEIFDMEVENLKAIFVRSVGHEVLVNLNDVVPVSADKFYVTRWSHANKEDGIWFTLEQLTQRALTKIMFCDQNDCRIVADSLQMPNGLEVSADLKYLYVAQCLAPSLLTYAIQEDFSIKAICNTKVDFAIDNLSVDDNGNVIGAGHYKPLHFMLHQTDPLRFNSPAKVIKIAVNSTNCDDTLSSTLYWREGTSESEFDLPGISTAHDVNGNLFMGGVFPDGILICKAL